MDEPGSTPDRTGIRVAKYADGAGVVSAIFAALCCAGTPLILSGLAVVGLTFLRSDAILWPLMEISLLVSLWGFWSGKRLHGATGPFVLALVSGIALSAGVIFVHGPPAMTLIYSGATGLLVSTVWNVVLRKRCAR